MLVVDPVMLGRLMDGDDIGAAIVIRGSGRDAIVVRAIILIAADHGHPGGVRVLTVLRNPEAAAGIKTEMRWLSDERLR